jgi:hypothetical protein
MKRHCVDEETLMDFIEDRLPPRERRRIETHLCSCADCRERLSLAVELARDNGVDSSDAAPAALTQRAVDAVAAQSRIKPAWQRRLEGWGTRLFTRKDQTSEPWPLGSDPQPMALRSGLDANHGVLIHDVITGPGFSAVVEVETVADSDFTIHVSPDPDGIGDVPLRVGLFAGECEMASTTFWDETVQFEQIPNGDYTLAFFRSSQQLATYAFSLKAD